MVKNGSNTACLLPLNWVLCVIYASKWPKNGKEPYLWAEWSRGDVVPVLKYSAEMTEKQTWDVSITIIVFWS